MTKTKDVNIYKIFEVVSTHFLTCLREFASNPRHTIHDFFQNLIHELNTNFTSLVYTQTKD